MRDLNKFAYYYGNDYTCHISYEAAFESVPHLFYMSYAEIKG
jgi:hypothetical protein